MTFESLVPNVTLGFAILAILNSIGSVSCQDGLTTDCDWKSIKHKHCVIAREGGYGFCKPTGGILFQVRETPKG